MKANDFVFISKKQTTKFVWACITEVDFDTALQTIAECKKLSMLNGICTLIYIYVVLPYMPV